jgi:hypothetical protein
MSFEWDYTGTMASNIAKNVFFKADEPVHTCFCVGSEEMVLNLLFGFTQEGKKIEGKEPVNLATRRQESTVEPNRLFRFT